MTMPVSEYGIITEYEHHSLAVRVQEQLEEGWQPLGTPYTSIQGIFFTHQAMVKYKTVKRKPVVKKAAKKK